MNRILLIVGLLTIQSLHLHAQETPQFKDYELLEIEGAYLGQSLPGNFPELFAPTIISTAHHEHGALSISPDGKEMYWSRIDLPLERRSLHKIYHTRMIGDRWTKPQIASFSGINSDDGPKFSYDGKRLYYYSRLTYSEQGNMPKHNIFYVEKDQNTWSDPVKIGPNINTSAVESSVSITEKNDLFFARGGFNHFFKSEFKNGEYQTPKTILEDAYNSFQLNISPFINKEGNMLLFGSVNRSDGFGASDLYVSFLDETQKWSDPINLGNHINTTSNERFPSLSPDGKYLFFVSNRAKEEVRGRQDVPENGLGDIYWVDASFLYTLKDKEHTDNAVVYLEKNLLRNGIEDTKTRIDSEKFSSLDEASLNRLGYKFLQNQKINEALFVLHLNTQKHNNSANTYDSYAEALLAAGDKKEAIIQYKKSFELNPQNTNARNLIGYLSSNPEYITINSRKFHCIKEGKNGASIVLLNGMNRDLKYWFSIIPELRKSNTVFTYDPVGIGKSEKGEYPQYGEAYIKDLKLLLEQNNIPKPYIFVAHSFGGMYARLFASRNPEDVAGMVLIDATTVNLEEEILKVLDEKDKSNFEQFIKMRPKAMTETSNLIMQSKFPEIPLLVLTAGNYNMLTRYDSATRARTLEVSRRLSKEMSTISPLGEEIIVEGSGHVIHEDKPQFVIDAILKIVEQSNLK